MTEPDLRKLSIELIFLKTVYETRERPLPFNEPVELLAPLGYPKWKWSMAWDMLDDQGVIYEPWGLTADGAHCRVFKVCDHAMEFAKTISEHWPEAVARAETAP